MEGEEYRGGEAMEVEAEGASTDAEDWEYQGEGPPGREYRGEGMIVASNIPVGGVNGSVNDSAIGGRAGAVKGAVKRSVKRGVKGSGAFVGSVVEVEVAEGGEVSWQFARVVAMLPGGEFDAMIADDPFFIERCAGGGKGREGEMGGWGGCGRGGRGSVVAVCAGGGDAARRRVRRDDCGRSFFHKEARGVGLLGQGVLGMLCLGQPSSCLG
jgi:hypothetical protein